MIMIRHLFNKSRVSEMIIHDLPRIYNEKSSLAVRPRIVKGDRLLRRGPATGSSAARSGADFGLDSIKYI